MLPLRRPLRWRGFEAEAFEYRPPVLARAQPAAERQSLPAAGKPGRPALKPAGAFLRAEVLRGHGPPTLAHGRPALGGWRFNRMSAANFPSCPN